MANRLVSRRLPGWHGPLAGTAAYTVGLLLFTGSVGAAPAIDCSTEALALAREEAELPRLEVASPADRPPLHHARNHHGVCKPREGARGALPAAGSHPDRRRMGQQADQVFQIVQSVPVQANALVSRFRRSYHFAAPAFTNVGNKGTLASHDPSVALHLTFL